MQTELRHHAMTAVLVLVAGPVFAQAASEGCLGERHSPATALTGPPGFPASGSPYPTPTGGCERSPFSYLTSTCQLICVEYPGEADVAEMRHEVLVGQGIDDLRWMAVQEEGGPDGVGWLVMGGQARPQGTARHCVIASNRVLAQQRASVIVRVVVRYRLPQGRCR